MGKPCCPVESQHGVVAPQWKRHIAVMNLWPTVKLCTFKHFKCLKVRVVHLITEIQYQMWLLMRVDASLEVVWSNMKCDFFPKWSACHFSPQHWVGNDVPIAPVLLLCSCLVCNGSKFILRLSSHFLWMILSNCLTAPPRTLSVNISRSLTSLRPIAGVTQSTDAMAYKSDQFRYICRH